MITALTRYNTHRPDFTEALHNALAAFAAARGFCGGEIVRATDDTALHCMIVRFDSIGSYRRALSSYRVKAEAVPLMYQAIEEPTCFEQLRAFSGDGDITISSSDVSGAADRGATRLPIK